MMKKLQTQGIPQKGGVIAFWGKLNKSKVVLRYPVLIGVSLGMVMVDYRSTLEIYKHMEIFQAPRLGWIWAFHLKPSRRSSSIAAPTARKAMKAMKAMKALKKIKATR